MRNWESFHFSERRECNSGFQSKYNVVYAFKWIVKIELNAGFIHKSQLIDTWIKKKKVKR